MIQRIQSVFLAFVSIISGIGMILGDEFLDLISDFNEELIVYGIIILLAIVAIVSYKKRSKQMQLNNLNVLVNILLIGVSVYYLLNLPGGFIPEKGIELIVPCVNIIMLVLANRFIKKDIALVKSVDRIR